MKSMLEAGRETLEVLVYFDGALLGAHHLARGESLVFGPPASATGVDYPIDDLALPLAVAEHGAAMTVAFPDGASGIDGAVTLADGGRRTLAQLREQGLCQQVTGGHRYALPEGARAALHLGGLLVSIAATELSLQRLPWRGRTQLRSQRCLGASLLIHGVVLGLALLAPPDPSALASQDLSRFDNETLRTRFIPVMPELKPPVAQTGAGNTPAAGPAGTTGNMQAPRHLVARSRTTAPVQRHGDDLRAEVRDTSLLALLGRTKHSASVAALFDERHSALGDDSQNVLSTLVALADQDGWGTHGMNIVGTDHGGGCVGTDCGLIAATQLDRICRGGNCGNGPVTPLHEPPGTLSLPRHRPEGPDLSFGTPTTSVGLDRDTVRRVIRSRMNEFRYCYERELTRSPELSGRVVVSFLIGKDGRVVSASTQESSMKSPQVATCVSLAVQRLSFPQPQGASLVQVSYPFLFQSIGR